MRYENDKSLILVSKGDLLCHAEMEQVLWVKVQLGAKVVGKAKVEWVARLRRDRAAFVHAPTVAMKKGIE
ncbi:hypothetical protein ACFL3Q_17630 [Planctomycetota bacterium]